MNEPDDFGLDAVRTLSQVADPTPARWHATFWRSWHGLLHACEPSLDRIGSIDSSGPTHVVLGPGSVRLFCRVLEPTSPVRATLLTTHGYSGVDDLSGAAQTWRSLGDRGVQIVQMAVRGFPPSDADTGDLRNPDTGGWISRGLVASPDKPAELLDWSYPLALADMACVARAAIAHADGAPLMLHGESFGGGLAVALAGLLPGVVTRLVIGLPTMGDWPWRLEHRAGGGLGAEVDRFIIDHARLSIDHERSIAQTLRLADSVVHARHVACPTLCKLALRDDVVPAPTAAAIYNALGPAASRRARFVVPYGHFDGGIANERRHALFRRMAIEFLDPSLDPADVIDRWEPLLTGGTRPPTATPEPRKERHHDH